MVIKKYFDSHREHGTVPQELNGIDVKLYDNIKEFKTWRNNRKGIEWIDEEQNKLHGAIDDLLIASSNKLIVLDYKTRGFPLKEETPFYYQDQLTIYNFLLRKKGFSTKDYSYLLFYYPSHIDTDGKVAFHTRLVELQTPNVDLVEKNFYEAIRVLRQKKAPKQSDKCNFCNWTKKIKV